MTRRRSTLAQLSRLLYLASRTTGDAAAAERGPEALAKRVARRQVTRTLWRLFR